ncbi:MAG: SurA N-terminal domain-containing protein [Flavobacteriaceae bacterium]|nr:SurA N-terminal domain-containing protein [Flavobacteriaceae bacterium]
MAILGKIRERSFFLIIVIGLALFAFIISGVFGPGNSGGLNNEPIGIVNGEEVLLENFRLLVEQEQRSNGYSSIQAVNIVWDQYVQGLVLKSQFDISSIDAGKNQIEQVISSNKNIVEDERFINEAGFFDFGIFSNFIIQLRQENPTAYESWKIQEANIIGSAKQSIYFDLIRSSISYPENQVKEMYHIENDKVDISYVKIPFNTISDSIINVSEKEIEEYISSNKEKYDFKPIRSLDYVIFNEIPTNEDEKVIRDQLEDLLEDIIEYNEVSKLSDTIVGFKNTENIIDFVDKYSEASFDSIYQPKGRLAAEYGELLYNLNVGEVYGPYKEIGMLKISRLLDRKKNGSIRASQIFISHNEANQAITRNKQEAKLLANRLFRQLKRNSNKFQSFIEEFSDGVGKNTGGDIGFFNESNIDPKIFKTLLRSRLGSFNLIETEFGFHIIKATDRQDLLLFANIVKKIIPSDKTSNEVFKNATKFEIDLISDKDIFSLAKKNNYIVRNINYVDKLDENLPGLPNQRAIVQWAFNEDSEEGMVKKFNLSFGGYAIVKLSKIDDEGLISSKDIKEEVRNILINEKKAKLILNSNRNLSIVELAAKNKIEIIDASSITQSNQTLVGAGKEPYVIGSAFGLKKGETSSLIVGKDGVYKIQLKNKQIAEKLEDYSDEINFKIKSEQTDLGSVFYQSLKNSSEIIDNRSLYY